MRTWIITAAFIVGYSLNPTLKIPTPVAFFWIMMLVIGLVADIFEYFKD